ncbi:hypothetical protein FM042_05270 [Aliidiomarina halalkaliphila]|uniref:Uncharacterized protein n=1 Tax=Aliidiomarina halalkaliphila TaxID=2593535 RepID=A0A552X5J7_9GAMM|nr:hypothetical protein [Aliidiomarina halalkaliphila]TRW50246.1 hypothetical protein FM042_05270 [Aliidiomarina halalkaliphila]
MFKSLKNMWRMAQAATVLEQIVEEELRYNAHLSVGDYKAFARKIIEHSWELNKQTYSGKIGPRPKSVTIAICAVAEALERVEFGSDAHFILSSSFSTLSTHLIKNDFAYDLKKIDELLIDEALKRGARKLEEFANKSRDMFSYAGFSMEDFSGAEDPDAIGSENLEHTKQDAVIK